MVYTRWKYLAYYTIAFITGEPCYKFNPSQIPITGVSPIK